MTFPSDESLHAYVAKLESVNPAALQVFASEDEGQFLEAVEGALAAAIGHVESGARRLSTLDEQGLSWILVKLLVAASIRATAEGYHNGHVDVTVEHERLPLIYLGECKIHDGYEWHLKGCTQVLDRYSSGRASRTFVLDFFKAKGMYEKLNALMGRFKTERPLRQQGDPRGHALKGAFVSTHMHWTETPVEILHIGCNTYHPEG